METARKLAMHHQEVILPKAGEVTSLVIRQCQNGRSKVARYALEGLKDLYRYLRRNLIGQLDAGAWLHITLYNATAKGPKKSKCVGKTAKIENARSQLSKFWFWEIPKRALAVK